MEVLEIKGRMSVGRTESFREIIERTWEEDEIFLVIAFSVVS